MSRPTQGAKAPSCIILVAMYYTNLLRVIASLMVTGWVCLINLKVTNQRSYWNVFVVAIDTIVTVIFNLRVNYNET